MATDQLKRAYEAAQKLSLKDQNTLADKILEEIEEPPDVLYGFSKDGVFIGGNNVFHIVGILSFVERWKDHPEKIKALEDELQDVIDRHVFSHPLKGEEHLAGKREWVPGQNLEAPLQ
jgi:hypothetical protein